MTLNGAFLPMADVAGVMGRLAQYRGPGPKGGFVTNHIALWLFALLAAAALGDIFLNDSDAMFFLAREFLDLIEWVVFWR